MDATPSTPPEPPEQDRPEPAGSGAAAPRGSRRLNLLDLMAVVATCSLLFAAHRSLADALRGRPEEHMATIATGMLLVVAVGQALLRTLQRRYGWRGLAESRDFLIAMLLAIGLPAGAFSFLAAPAAGVLYLAATLVLLVHAMRRPSRVEG